MVRAVSKGCLVRTALPKTTESGICEPCGKKTYLLCNSIKTIQLLQRKLAEKLSTFTTQACEETFRIQVNCNPGKVLYLLKCSVCSQAPYVGKAKTKFPYRFNNYKSKHKALRKGNRKIPRKVFHDHYCLDGHLGIDD